MPKSYSMQVCLFVFLLSNEKKNVLHISYRTETKYIFDILSHFSIYSEIAKVQQTGRIPQREQKYVDIYREKQIRVTVKVLVPVKEHPKVRLLGC